MTARTSGSNAPLRVVVVDDDPMARRALRDALTAGAMMTVAGEASSGAAAEAAVRDARPDVVVIDADIPDVDGLTATRRLSVSHPGLPVLVLAARDDDQLALNALRAGASGFLSKAVAPEAIARATRGVAEGEAAISRRLTFRVVAELRALSRLRARPGVSEPGLTPRETEVLDLLAENASTTEMAQRLGLSTATVRTHVKHVLRKLGVHTRADAVAAARQRRGNGGDVIAGPWK
jgi:NarL family two-component system response regulator LiaR